MREQHARVIELLGERVEYTVRESSEATESRIYVDIQGVTVVLPKSGKEDPEQLLEENGVWVLDKKEKYGRYRSEIPERRVEAGEQFPYLGDQLEIVVETRPSSAVDSESFRLARHHVEGTSVKRALKTLYRRKAREKFDETAEEFARRMGVEYQKIDVRNQRTKWGSCSTTGTLGLNWRLMMAPEEKLECIIVHELAHLRESNHTAAFWNFVAEFDPEYQEHAEWLSENGTELVFSADDI